MIASFPRKWSIRKIESSGNSELSASLHFRLASSTSRSHRAVCNAPREFRSSQPAGLIRGRRPAIDTNWLVVQTSGCVAQPDRLCHPVRHADADDGGGPWIKLASISTGLGPTAMLRRSEEHTSELQSLRHLVCRL